MEENQDTSKPFYAQGSGMKKCPSCNAEIPQDSVYCEFCGNKVSDSRPVSSADTNTNNSSRPERPNNYLGLAIACILFCWPFGIPSIVNAAKVNRLWEEGRYEEAQAASDSARNNGTTGLVIGIIINVLYVVLMMTGAIGGF